MSNLKQTQRIEVTPAMLDAAFPEHRLSRRRYDTPACPAELIADAVEAAAMRDCGMADTQEMPVCPEIEEGRSLYETFPTSITRRP